MKWLANTTKNVQYRTQPEICMIVIKKGITIGALSIITTIGKGVHECHKGCNKR